MPYAIPISAYFPTKPGLSTVGFTPAGLPRVASGVVESIAVPGLYLATATLPDGYAGVIDWDTGQGSASLHAYDMVSPPATASLVPLAATVTTGAGAGPLGQAYCADEDIAARALDDFTVLVPSWQVQAQGADGTFDPGYPWLLRSTTVDFRAAGVHARQVCQLTAPPSLPQYRGATGDLLAIEGVSTDGSSLQLRRIGKPPGAGQPPAPFAGLTGVTFVVRTFDWQIDVASDDANRLMGYDPALADRPPPYDLRSLQQFVVLSVLKRVYASRVKGQESDLKQRYELVIGEWEELKGHVVLRFGPRGQGAAAATAMGGRVRR